MARIYDNLFILLMNACIIYSFRLLNKSCYQLSCTFFGYLYPFLFGSHYIQLHCVLLNGFTVVYLASSLEMNTGLLFCILLLLTMFQ